MYTVYKITNLVNEKCYIGSSVNVEKRWTQEKNSAFNPNSKSYNYPLSCAFRKYGLENFKFEILKQNFENASSMREYEKEMIIKYNSLDKGYNQTLYTLNPLDDPIIKERVLLEKGQKCAKVDQYENILEEYNSYQDASRKLGKGDNASGIRKVCKGEFSSLYGLYFRDLDDKGKVVSIPFAFYKGKHPVIGIKIDEPEICYYGETITEIAQIFNTDRHSISKCCNGNKKYSYIKGYVWRYLDFYGNIIEPELTSDKVIEDYNKTHPEINGVRKTITEWCKEYSISKSSYYKRIKKGMSVIEAITTTKKR